MEIPHEPWHDRVKKAINALCRAEYIRANTLPNGKPRRKYVPYSVPQEAIELLDCLNKNDEKRAKSMLLWDYELRDV